MLWKALNQDDTWGIDLSKLKAKLRHKMHKLGLYQPNNRLLSTAETLLRPVKGKKRRSHRLEQ